MSAAAPEIVTCSAAYRIAHSADAAGRDASTSPIAGAHIYNWKVTLASNPETVAAQLQTTGAEASFAGLTRGTIYNVQVNAVGTAGTTEWSDAANITAP